MAGSYKDPQSTQPHRQSLCIQIELDLTVNRLSDVSSLMCQLMNVCTRPGSVFRFPVHSEINRLLIERCFPVDASIDDDQLTASPKCVPLVLPVRIDRARLACELIGEQSTLECEPVKYFPYDVSSDAVGQGATEICVWVSGCLSV